MTHKVVFAPEAQADLLKLYDTIAKDGGEERALAYVERIEGACLNLATFPERGARHDDIRPGLRVIGFARRIAIAFHVTTEMVTIDRILYGGQEFGAAFEEG